MNRQATGKIYSYSVIFLLSTGLFLTVGPLVWMLISAFTDPICFTKDAPHSMVFSIQNFRVLFTDGRILHWALNSLFVATAITFAQMLFNSLAAFGFSVGRFRGRELLFWLIMVGMMVPGQIVMLPLFLFMSKWGLIDNLWAVVLPAMAAPFGIYLIRQYMDSIPRELVEAARMDGAGEFEIYRRMFLPLSRPILATSGIFIFITHWNAFLWPLVTLTSDANYTLTVGLSLLQDQQIMDYGLLMAGATVAALPMVVIFLIFSRSLLEGMRGGSVK
ncbi:MAG: carbohydrate ABC transporter permease [Candidatus Riflebacteria bacterium]|nr:carbohydrate ABC transporter permease [Candidatus Riflebacteria bacterium]